MYSSRRRDAHLPGHRPAIGANLLYIISVLAGGALGNATGAVGRLLAGLPAGVHRQRTLRRSGHLALRRALGARVPAPSKGKLCGAPRPHFSPFSRAIRRSSRRTIHNWELCIMAVLGHTQRADRRMPGAVTGTTNDRPRRSGAYGGAESAIAIRACLLLTLGGSGSQSSSSPKTGLPLHNFAMAFLATPVV